MDCRVVVLKGGPQPKAFDDGVEGGLLKMDVLTLGPQRHGSDLFSLGHFLCGCFAFQFAFRGRCTRGF